MDISCLAHALIVAVVAYITPSYICIYETVDTIRYGRGGRDGRNGRDAKRGKLNYYWRMVAPRACI